MLGRISPLSLNLFGQMKKWEAFWKERERLNELVLENADKVTKRFFSLDSQVYREGSIPIKYKELMGLVASLVLRCDDCITYHMVQCHRSGVSRDELIEAMSIALVVGGSIVIPHLRRAYEIMEELYSEEQA